MPANTIYYSDKYYDDTYEYRCGAAYALMSLHNGRIAL